VPLALDLAALAIWLAVAGGSFVQHDFMDFFLR
jgi:hypothetical protein